MPTDFSPQNTFKSGFVNIVGNPNVGKSTLMNRLVGEKMSIITHKAQTTRHRIVGIVNTPSMQVVYSDTPGVLKPGYHLHERMRSFSESALSDADILLYVTDVIEKVDKNLDFLEKVKELSIPLLVLINKIDLTDEARLNELVATWHELLPQAEILPISVLHNFGIKVLEERIKELLPEAPPYYEQDQLTDRPLRFFVSEIIREKILRYYKQEIPYAAEVVIENYKELPSAIEISCLILVERPSQRAIILGKEGRAIKRFTTAARRALEGYLGKHVRLDTFVKVDSDWRNNNSELDRLGYRTD